MTAETRNALAYDRELIAQMLDVCGHPKFTLAAYREQADLIRAADNATAQAETVSRPPAAARGDVRGLVATWRKRAAAYGYAGYTGAYSEGRSDAQNECADELEAALAAEGVQAEPKAEARGGVLHELCDCPNGRAEHSPSCAALTESRNGR